MRSGIWFVDLNFCGFDWKTHYHFLFNILKYIWIFLTSLLYLSALDAIIFLIFCVNMVNLLYHSFYSFRILFNIWSFQIPYILHTSLSKSITSLSQICFILISASFTDSSLTINYIPIPIGFTLVFVTWCNWYWCCFFKYIDLGIKRDNNIYNKKLSHIYVMTKWMANNYFLS